jgi:hypothetical protein
VYLRIATTFVRKMAHLMRSRLADVTNTGIDASQGRKRSRAQAEEQDDAIKASIGPSRTLFQDKGNKIPTASPSISPAAGFDVRRGCNHRLLRQSRLALSSLSTTPCKRLLYLLGTILTVFYSVNASHP